MTPDLPSLCLPLRPPIGPHWGRKPAPTPRQKLAKAGAAALRPVLAASLVALGAMAPLAGLAWEVRGGAVSGDRIDGNRIDGNRGGVGGAYRFNGDDWRGGYNGAHPLYGDGARPAYGQGFNPGSNSRPAGVNPYNSNDNRINNYPYNRAVVNPYNRPYNGAYNGPNNFYNRPYNGWHSGWNNGGYWNSRPWNAGWYRWTPNSWGWWGGNAMAWGLAGLATGAAITSLVNNAAAVQSPLIMVPQTNYQLNYGSVEAVGNYGVSFNYLVNGMPVYGAANCQQGLINGQIPNNSNQAQLLNAVCQVAYGNGG